MVFPNRKIVEHVRREYPVGTRVELVRMHDKQAPPVGMTGTVLGVDDMASLLTHWDNGSRLNVVYGEDCVKKIPIVRTVCYGKTEEWYSRKEAEEFFFQASLGSEGSEQSRYMKIYNELKMGLDFCTDGEDL